MSSQFPITIDGSDALAAAIRLRAEKEGASPEAVVDGILRRALAAEIEELSGALPLAVVIQKVMQAGPRSA